MIDGKTKIIIIQAAAIVVISCLLIKSCGRSYTGSAIPSQDAIVSKHTVTPSAPLLALDKAELVRVADVPESVIDNDRAEVLATGTVADDSGTRTIAAVLDTTTGGTSLVEKRPFFELMNRQELGIGYGLASGGEMRQVFYRNTVARVGDFYASALVTVDDRTAAGQTASWAAMAQLSYRW